MQLGQVSLTGGESASKSDFSAQGYMFEAGTSFGTRNGVAIGGEYGYVKGINSSSSQTYIETASLNQYAAKLYAFIDGVGLGGGYRHVEARVRSIDTSSGYLETVSSGFVPFAVLNYSLDFHQHWRLTLEGQAASGTLKGSGSANDATYTDLSASLRLFLILD